MCVCVGATKRVLLAGLCHANVIVWVILIRIRFVCFACRQTAIVLKRHGAKRCVSFAFVCFLFAQSRLASFAVPLLHGIRSYVWCFAPTFPSFAISIIFVFLVSVYSFCCWCILLNGQKIMRTISRSYRHRHRHRHRHHRLVNEQQTN